MNLWVPERQRLMLPGEHIAQRYWQHAMCCCVQYTPGLGSCEHCTNTPRYLLVTIAGTTACSCRDWGGGNSTEYHAITGSFQTEHYEGFGPPYDDWCPYAFLGDEQLVETEYAHGGGTPCVDGSTSDETSNIRIEAEIESGPLYNFSDPTAAYISLTSGNDISIWAPSAPSGTGAIAGNESAGALGDCIDGETMNNLVASGDCTNDEAVCYGGTLTIAAA